MMGRECLFISNESFELYLSVALLASKVKNIAAFPRESIQLLTQSTMYESSLVTAFNFVNSTQKRMDLSFSKKILSVRSIQSVQVW